MSYFVTVSFDLKNAQWEDYERIYNAFAALGLKKQLNASNGNVVQLPTTTCAGEFNGASAGAVCDDLASRCKAAVEQLNLSGEVFVAVGGDWAWAHRTPKANPLPIKVRLPNR